MLVWVRMSKTPINYPSILPLKTAIITSFVILLHTKTDTIEISEDEDKAMILGISGVRSLTEQQAKTVKKQLLILATKSTI